MPTRAEGCWSVSGQMPELSGFLAYVLAWLKPFKRREQDGVYHLRSGSSCARVKSDPCLFNWLRQHIG